MALLIGQSVDGRELEQATSPWPPDRFASMCDALAWAASGRQCTSLPSFTTRVNAKDAGIDAEWRVELPDNGRSVPTPILGPGLNVFQYKKRDLMAQDRRRIISQLKSSLREAISDLIERNKRLPDRYILFVNIDLKHNDKAALKESILKGYQCPQGLHVEIIGAAELAALLNNYPHLRAAYFAPLSFKTWEEAFRAHQKQKFIGSGVDLIGREADLGRFKSWVDDPHVRVIVLSGPHNIGKSRLALEATRHRPHDIVIALDPRSMGLGDYRNLCTNLGEVICIVEDPEPDSVESLVSEALSLPHLKLIITLPTSANAPEPSYGRDERVQSLHLKPLAEEDAQKLLRATGQPLGFEIEDWIIRQAGGVPGVLLAATIVGRHRIQRDLRGFVETVGRGFEKRIQNEIGSDALRCTRLFSILTHVGVSGEAGAELKQICDLFGEGWTPNAALLSLADLEQAGLARRGGSFAEITLPLLANYLVVQLLRGQRNEMFALFGRLNEPGRIRFIRRLSEIKGEEVKLFWDEAFAQGGPFGDFQAALANVHLLRLVAGTVPDRTLRLLERSLQNTSREERLAIAGNQRRELIWTLEQLLFRLQTSRRALRLLWLLAEAENEKYANNATAVLAECFHPFHPQMPLPLQERIELLREFLSQGSSKQGKLVVIEAVSSALRREMAFLSFSHSTGLEPFDSRPIFTYGDFCDYCRDLVDTLIFLVEGEDEVVAAALGALPGLIAEMGIQARPQDALERFSRLIDWARSGKPGLDVSSLFDRLHRMHNVLSKKLDKPGFPLDQRGKFEGYIAQLDQLKADLETANFATRLKRWTGKWAYGDESTSTGSSRLEKELEKLADEAAKNPNLLNADLIEWLLSSANWLRSQAFFFFLGRSDERGVFRECIEKLGQRPDGADAFSAYWGGWAKRDPEGAKKRLDQLAGSNALTGNAIVRATGRLRVDQAAIDRVRAQIQAGRVDPGYAGREILAGRRIEGLTEGQFEQLLKAVVGETFEHAAAAIDMVGMWMDLGMSLQGNVANLAWRCLEQDPPVSSPSDPWDFDRLAAKLAQDDPERGFRLMERLARRDEREINHWDPLAQYGEYQFWNVLHASDRKRLVALMLNIARVDALKQFHLSWRLRDLLDQEGDKDLLLSFAEGDIENARIIADWITSAKPGFWFIAFKLVQTCPHDEILLGNLTGGFMQQGIAFWGSISQFYEARKQEAEQVLQKPSTPPKVRAWLREVVGRLEREITREIVWEYDMDVEDLRHHIQDKGSAQRIWAIGRVLKYAAWEDIRRLLTAEDIEEAISHVDLPEKKRKMLEKAVEVWRHGK